jgi:hypothetical protein
VVHARQESSVAKITIFRPDGQQSYENAEVNSVENGVANFSVEDRSEKYVRKSFLTNLPFMIEHNE